MTVLQKFLNTNVWIARLFDCLLPEYLLADGNRTFIEEYVPKVLERDSLLYDLGGGSQPCISLETKNDYSLSVVGFDISEEELSAAPLGIYDRLIVADLCSYTGNVDADSVVCQATLEHVQDVTSAIASIASMIKPGGKAYIFVPCRNALFARLNLVLPEFFKKYLLFKLFPNKAQGHDGFKAYYNKCIPSQIEKIAIANNFVVEERRLFWKSSYFTIFFPAYLLWRVYQLVLFTCIQSDAAETFIYVLKKESTPSNIL